MNLASRVAGSLLRPTQAGAVVSTHQISALLMNPRPGFLHYSAERQRIAY